jgi:hypothetical protein
MNGAMAPPTPSMSRIRRDQGNSSRQRLGAVRDQGRASSASPISGEISYGERWQKTQRPINIFSMNQYRLAPPLTFSYRVVSSSCSFLLLSIAADERVVTDSVSAGNLSGQWQDVIEISGGST